MRILRKIGGFLLLLGLLNIYFEASVGSFGRVLLLVSILLYILNTFLTQKRFNQSKFTIGAISIFIFVESIAILTRAYGFIQNLNHLVILLSIGALTYLFYSETPFFRSLFEFITFPFSLIKHHFLGLIRSFDRVLFTMLDQRNNVGSVTKVIKTIIISIIVGVPITFVLVGLLSSADPIFNSKIKNIFHFVIPENLIVRAIYNGVMSLIFFPVLFMVRKNTEQKGIENLHQKPFFHEISLVMIWVSIILGGFLFVQYPYVFANVPFETNLSQFGVATYSEYVRRGFTEFLAVSFILYVLVWIGLIALRSRKHNQKTILPIVQVIVIVEFLIFLFSLFRRIWLYQSYHGLSLIRIYGGIFLIWVLAITVILLLRHFFNRKWVRYEIAATVVTLIFVSFFNAEHFIATAHPPTVNKRIDHTYLARLSEDGYVGWKMAYQNAKETLEKFEQKDFYDANDRRDIILSGYVLKDLMKKYESSSVYASPEEKAAIEIKTIDKLLARNAKIVAGLETDFRDFSLSTDSANRYKQEIDTQMQLRGKLMTRKNQIATDPAQKASDIAISFNDSDYFYLKSFLINPCNNMDQSHSIVEAYKYYSGSSDVCTQGFHMVTTDSYELKQIKKWELNSLEKIFTWNFQKARTYERMKSDMPYDELSRLESIYFSELNKIVKQKEEDRTINIDVSFDTPLIHR